ncbi:uncharacterized conserved protein [Zunongwangia profunda SM-A87]|uniref:Uncharacterized conserved protein n=1 Tax=Zunongwangia profunda (strain DSM 18752 / CCTCC AB 206139 / SM-A87) TaxID=655815 RepID=D5BAU5_ZUNPS|nr:DUF937 domain-containing protein [Zunongwangia profunda]ADF52458.1 uncharacterized conserved protein [Zunongwangia profunda SM-A87]
MASILDILNTNLGKELINKASNKTGVSSNNVSSVLGMVLPLILGNFKNKIQEGYSEALNEMLEEAPNPFKFMTVFSQKETKELIQCGHDYSEMILGENFSSVINTISDSLNVDKEAVQEITTISIPLVIAILSIQKKKENINKDKDIEDLIDSALGSSSKYNNSFFDTIFNIKNDPNFIPEASEMVIGKKNKKDSILKGYTGGK